MNTKYERLESLDIAKGIGIILVVVGHAISALGKVSLPLEILRFYIYLVHMPLFFIAAGYLFQRGLQNYESKGFVAFLKKKSLLYMMPYCLFSVVMYLIVLLTANIGAIAQFVNGNFGNPPELLYFARSLILCDHPLDDHLWFSYVMFLVLLISYIVRRLPVEKMLPVLYLLYVLTWFIGFPELVWKVMRYMLLFSIGRLYMEHREKIENKSLQAAVMFLFTSVAYYLLRENGIFINGFIKPFAECSGVYLLLFLAKGIYDCTKCERSRNILHCLGRESYIIYLLHQPYIVPVLAKIGLHLSMPNLFNIVFASIFGVIVPILVNKWIVSKNKLLSLLCLGKTWLRKES